MTGASERETRRAAALRENLKRRKSQARERAAGNDAPADPPKPAGTVPPPAEPDEGT